MGTPGDTMVWVAGRRFYCACGCSVFRLISLKVYRCNSCGEEYERQVIEFPHARRPFPCFLLFGHHAPRRFWRYKHNGGRGVWLCPWCRTILLYGRER
jgi:hypothetical protein